MKKALVLGGGGSKGAYEIGVWKALDTLGEHFDLVCGTSIGAMIGILYVQQEYEKAYELWSNLQVDDVVMNGIDLDIDMELLMSQKGKYKAFFESFVEHKGVDISPFDQMIHRLFDAEKFFSSPIDYGCMSVNVTKRCAVAFKKCDMDETTALHYVMASASCYPAFPMKQIGDEKFVDGGYADNVPIKLAQAMGADEIVAVDLKSVGNKVVKEPVEHVTYIEPYVSLGSFLLFDHDRIMKNMELGYRDTMKKYHRYLGTLYTFFIEEQEVMNVFEERMQEGFYHLKEDMDMENMHVIAEKITSKFLLMGLKKYERNQYPFCAMLENIAQSFSIDMDPIYHFSDFQSKVMEVVEVYTPNLHAELSDIENIKLLFQSVKDIKLAELICIHYYYLHKDEKNMAMIQVLATLANDSFLLAYLLYLMKTMYLT